MAILVCFDPVSYNGSVWKPLSDDQAEITFLQRHAVGAGRNVRAQLILGITPTRYGLEEGVVQTMYDAFPRLWEPFVDQRNRPAFSVQIPAEPNEAEIRQAERIQGYFKFCEDQGITSSGKIPSSKSVARRVSGTRDRDNN